MNNNLNYEIKFIINNFNKIRKLGYIKCEYNDTGGPGRKLEKMLLGKKPDNLRKPDFGNFELKTYNGNNKYNITLFSLIPHVDNMNFDDIMNFFLNFSKSSNKLSFNNKILPTFYLKVDTKKINFYKNKYKFAIFFDDLNRKMVLKCYDENFNLLPHQIFWYYDKIINEFKMKMKNLIFVNYTKCKVKNVLYCKYEKISFLICDNEERIIEMLKNGTINLSFNISSKYDDSNNAIPYYRGIKFEINEKNLDKLYFKYL